MTEIAAKVYEAVKNKSLREPSRRYLGMSQIGDPCRRKLWLGYRGGEKTWNDARLFRIFSAGHSIEKRIITDLEEAGFVLNYFQYPLGDLNNRFLGHIDGTIEIDGELRLLEIKSANAASFEKYKKHGITKESNPKYYAQVQCYLHYLRKDRISVKGATFVIENKNTQELLFTNVERDDDAAAQLRQRALSVVIAQKAFDRSKNISSYLCNRFCEFNGICEDESKHPKPDDTKCLDCRFFRSANGYRRNRMIAVSRIANYKGRLSKVAAQLGDMLPGYRASIESHLPENPDAKGIMDILSFESWPTRDFCAYPAHSKALKKVTGCKDFMEATLDGE